MAKIVATGAELSLDVLHNKYNGYYPSLLSHDSIKQPIII